MNRTLGVLFALVLLPSAAVAAPGLLPISGWLADTAGVGLDANVDLTVNVYADETGGIALFTDVLVVGVDEGFFTAYIGSGTGGAIDLAVFASEEELWLGLAVDLEAEMSPRLQIGTAPWAGFAEYAGLADDASSLGGVDASEFVTTSTEADPVYAASDAAAVTAANIANWSQAYGWGDHSAAGYLTSEADPTFASSPAALITATDLTNAVTSFGWGDHSTAGYITSEVDGSPLNELNTGVSLVGSTLSVSDAGTTFLTDLSPLYTAGTGLDMTGTTISLQTTGKIGAGGSSNSGSGGSAQTTSWFGIRFRIVAEPGGLGSRDGRLEFSPDGGSTWGTVCDDLFDMSDNQARVVCRSMGYSDGVLRDAQFVTDGTGSVYIDGMQCRADARNLADCRLNAIGNHNCGHSEDVGVTCSF